MHRLTPRALLVVALAATAGVGVLAAKQDDARPAAKPSFPANLFARGGITATAQAAPPGIVSAAVSVYTSRQLPASVAIAAFNAAHQAGAVGLITEGATLGMTAVVRAGKVVQAPPPGYRYGLSTSAVPSDAVGRIMSRTVAGVIAARQVVINQITATIHGIRAGDFVYLWNAAAHPVPLRVGLVAAPALTGGAEVLMTPELFHALGYYRPDEVVIFGFPSLTRLGQALTANGLVQPTIRIVRSWDPPNPDSTLSTANEKLKLGEFSYAGSGNAITQDAAWRSANIFRYAIPVDGGTINTYCHRLVEPGIQAALAEVTVRGLGALIDRANTNSAGGCYGAREVRANGSTTGGSISRHSWGSAIDMNTATNCVGCVPHMNCTIVQIFRKYGFAWGGNFLDPDGMHFEYVGERRDLLSYPSRYCPNVAGVTHTPSPNAPERAAVPPSPTATDSRDQLFVRPEEDESING